jgi:hypothetical protein
MKNNWLGILLLLASSSLFAMEMPYRSLLKTEGEELSSDNESDYSSASEDSEIELIPNTWDKITLTLQETREQLNAREKELQQNKALVDNLILTLDQANTKLDDAKKTADQLKDIEKTVLQQLEKGEEPVGWQTMLASVAERADIEQIKRWLGAAQKGRAYSESVEEKLFASSVRSDLLTSIIVICTAVVATNAMEEKKFRRASIGAAVTALSLAKLAQRKYKNRLDDVLAIPLLGTAVVWGGASLRCGLYALDKNAAAKEIGSLLKEPWITSAGLITFFAFLKPVFGSIGAIFSRIQNNIIAPLQSIQNKIQPGSQPGAIVPKATQAQSTWCTII